MYARMSIYVCVWECIYKCMYIYVYMRVCVCIYIYIYIYIYMNGGVRGVMVTVVRNENRDTSSNPRQDCISRCSNTLGKGVKPFILTPNMDR